MKFLGMFADVNAAYRKKLANGNHDAATLIAAHDTEINRVGADVWNYGWVFGGTGMASKTTKGILSTNFRDGEIKHTWDNYD
jgi:hypothetical protein